MACKIKKCPEEFATINVNLANAFSSLSDIKNKDLNIQKSIDALTESLKVYKFNQYPKKYALVQNNLGINYQGLAEVSANKKKDLP